MKKLKREVWLTSLVCLLPILAGAYFYPQLPKTVATHFSFDGTPNGYSSRFNAAISLPALLLVLHLVCCCGGARGLARGTESAATRRVILWICPFISVLCSSVTLGTALGGEMHITTLVPSAVGVLFLVMGNYMPKIRPNHTIGVRTPWTYTSEENWRYTHRITGFVWVIAGILMLVVSLLRLWQNWMTAVLLLLAAGVPIGASYLHYCRYERGNEHE